MAKLHKSSDPNLIECYGGPSGRKLIKTVRKSGQVIKNGHMVGHLKAGINVPDHAETCRKNPDYSDVRITFEGHNLGAAPIISQEKAEARKRAVERRLEASEREAQEEKDRIEHHGLETACIAFLRAGYTPRDTKANIIIKLAKFAGGVNVNLDGPMMAEMMMHGMTKEEKDELTAVSDRVARTVYGSDMAGAARWHKAIHGY